MKQLAATSFSTASNVYATIVHPPKTQQFALQNGIAIGFLKATGLRNKALAYDFWCAVRRHGFSAGANPARQLSLQPVAIGAAAEATKRLKPPGERVI